MSSRFIATSVSFRGLSGSAFITGLALLVSLLSASRGSAQTLTFEGLQNEEGVANYYNGGYGSLGSGPGPNFGITFGSDALALVQDQDGGSGNVANLPSGETCAFFLNGAGDVMDVAGGFNTGFSFYYCAINDPGQVNVYSGLDDTGTVLATLNLAVTPEISPAPDGGEEAFDNWQPVGVTFAGTAESVDFTGTANQITFDNITINSAVAGNPGVPEPTSLSLLLLGGLPLLMRRRRTGQNSR